MEVTEGGATVFSPMFGGLNEKELEAREARLKSEGDEKLMVLMRQYGVREPDKYGIVVDGEMLRRSVGSGARSIIASPNGLVSTVRRLGGDEVMSQQLQIGIRAVKAIARLTG